MENKIAGVKCQVTSCAHHTKDDCCTAGSIQVENTLATTEKETFCKTFKCKSGSCQ
jgi:hypothetical protein